MMDIQYILNQLPHRYPFLLVDRVLELERNQRIRAIKNVTFNEPHFIGHFPSRPIMPGVLIIEAMAQTSAVLVVTTLGKESEGKLVYFMSIDEAKFRKPVVPGDRLELDVEIKREIRNMTLYTCCAYVDGKQVACAEVLCAEVEG